MSFEPLQPRKYNYVDAKIKNEIDWRAAAMLLASNVQTLSDMVKRAYPDKPEIVDPLAEVDTFCAELIATGAIHGAKK